VSANAYLANRAETEPYRGSELVPQALARGTWDGVVLPYVPAPFGGDVAGLPLSREYDTDIDPVTYQVLRWRLWNINLEHDDTIRRVCGTSIVCHALDYNTSMLAEDGRTILGGPSLQRFVGQGDLSVRYTMAHRHPNPGISPGDVYILNDPYIATSHQLDVAAYQPFFWEGQLFCWFFNAAHCMDIGGSQPGSFCAEAKDIFDEPMTWPPIRLVHDGVVQQDVYDAFLRQSRSPAAIALNLRSQIAGLDTAVRRMTALLSEYGPRVVKGAMRRMLSDTSAAVRTRLREIPDGEWSETYLLGGLPDRRTRRLRTVLRKEGDVLVFSNEGTDAQLPTGNGTYCAFRSAAMSAVGTMLAWDQMYCPGGTLDRLRFDPYPGTFTIPSHPAGVTTVVGTNMAIALAGQVVSKMLLCGPEHLHRRALASGGLTSAGWCHAWGFDETGTLQFAPMTDSVIGALGASPGLDGVDTGGSWEWPRTSAGDVEEAEALAPLIYLYRREQADSGGPGRWRGGNGVEIAVMGNGVRQFYFQGEGNDPAVNSAPGLGGGMPAHCGDWLIRPDSGIQEAMAGGSVPATRAAMERELGPFDRVPVGQPFAIGADGIGIGEHAAGAGCGDPLRRDSALVLEDVRRGAVSAAGAERDYGVVIRDDEVDEQATVRHRQARREARSRAARPPVMPAEQPLPGQDGAGRPALAGMLFVPFEDGWYWACDNCRHVLALASGNARSGCALIETSPHSLDPVRYPPPATFCDDNLVIRQWICPGCAQLLITEFVRADDPPAWDVRLSDRALGQPAAQGTPGEQP
jgi:N-methylhydantoinase B